LLSLKKPSKSSLIFSSAAVLFGVLSVATLLRLV
jgi:hypothetical protein